MTTATDHHEVVMTNRDLPAEKQLRDAQKAVTAAAAALEVRNRLLIEMFDAGYPQYMLARILTEGSSRAGGTTTFSESAVQKAIRRNRSHT